MEAGHRAGTLFFSMCSNFFCEFREIHEFWEIHGFCNHYLGTGCAVGHQVVRKIVLCTACFACSLLVALVVLLSLLPYWTVFISIHEFYFLSILLPIPLREDGASAAAWSCLLAARFNHDSPSTSSSPSAPWTGSSHIWTTCSEGRREEQYQNCGKGCGNSIKTGEWL